MRYGGFYHLFYQYNPEGAVWGNIVWAHSVSKDLVNWTPLDHAIHPSQPSDIKGCWSGSATILPAEGTGMWECPDFFPVLNKKNTLTIGVDTSMIGDDVKHVLKNRRILLGWVNESSSVADDIKKGWSGIH
ncbi:beta-fructofuranosidase cell wall isozyme-like protein, partial [Trifolium pratense]